MKITSEDIYIEYTNLLNQGEIKGPGWIYLKGIFNRMNVTEKRELKKNNPTLYRELTTIERWGRGEII